MANRLQISWQCAGLMAFGVSFGDGILKKEITEGRGIDKFDWAHSYSYVYQFRKSLCDKSSTEQPKSSSSDNSNTAIGVKPKSQRDASNHSDPYDCHNPVCSETADMFKKLTSSSANSRSLKSTPKSPNLPKSVNSTFSKEKDQDKGHNTKEKKASATNEELEPMECPVDRNLLGQSTWNLMHTIAAYYSDNPTERDMTQAIRFIEALAYLYPCSYCAKDFQECIANSPPRVDSHASFVMWCCERHNEVNQKLGKGVCACDVKALDERWRYGSAECRRSTGGWDEGEDDEEDEEEKEGGDGEESQGGTRSNSCGNIDSASNSDKYVNNNLDGVDSSDSIHYPSRNAS